jgi:hypothetical protein
MEACPPLWLRVQLCENIGTEMQQWWPTIRIAPTCAQRRALSGVHDSPECKGQSAATVSPGERVSTAADPIWPRAHVDCDCYNFAFQRIGEAITLRAPENRRKNEAA